MSGRTEGGKVERPSPTFAPRVISRDFWRRRAAGVLQTAHGELRTPAFMPVGTKATVKMLDPDEVRDLGARSSSATRTTCRSGPERT